MFIKQHVTIKIKTIQSLAEHASYSNNVISWLPCKDDSVFQYYDLSQHTQLNSIPFITNLILYSSKCCYIYS